MSLCLTLAYHLRKELKSPPIEKECLEYVKNYHGKGYYGYEFDISQGPLVDLLTRDIDCLKKAIEPELFSKISIIGAEPFEEQDSITHDPAIMLTIALELKNKMEAKGEDFLKEIGFNETIYKNHIKALLLADLELFIIFCEFGIANGIRFNHQYF